MKLQIYRSIREMLFPVLNRYILTYSEFRAGLFLQVFLNLVGIGSNGLNRFFKSFFGYIEFFRPVSDFIIFADVDSLAV